MLTMLGTPRRCCDGLTRRETLQAGALSALGGLTLPRLLQAEQAANHGGFSWPGPARHVILLYLLGGAPTQDMYDLKPNAPDGVRSPFRPIASNVPGIDVCELLPGLARWMHRTALVRSVNHKAGCHNPLPSYTGSEQPLDNIVSTKDSYPPSMGSVCELLNRGQEVPGYLYLPCYLGWGQNIRRPGPYAGFLGASYNPLFTEVTPYTDPGVPRDLPGAPQVARGRPELPNSVLTDGMTVDRLDRRRSLLQQIDGERMRMEGAGQLGSFNRQTERAWSLLTGSPVRAAFDLEKEDPKRRDAYGRSLFGESTLIARRLIEAGARFVNVTWDIFYERLGINYDGWDTHTQNERVLRTYNLPYFDLAFTALMEDLEGRGLLDETLVVVMSEMGRTPRVNGNGGRDHWTYCYGTLLAGAGIQGGMVYGASDDQAAYVKDKPVSPADLCATVYRALGLPDEFVVHDPQGRPYGIAGTGHPISEILG